MFLITGLCIEFRVKFKLVHCLMNKDEANTSRFMDLVGVRAFGLGHDDLLNRRDCGCVGGMIHMTLGSSFSFLSLEIICSFTKGAGTGCDFAWPLIVVVHLHLLLLWTNNEGL
jgi:hypothetical protein